MAKCAVCGTVGPETGVPCPKECGYLVRESALEVNGRGLERYLGKLIGGRYAVVGYLGRGGMGAVYRARDLKGQGEVAVKVLLTHKPSKRAIRRFLREAKVAVRLRHPNIVATYGFGRVDDGFFLTMELVEGQPLSRYFKRGIPFDALLAIAMQSLAALDAAHAGNVIHRDLKPGNILVGRNERGGLMVKMVDFGLARFLQSERDNLTRTGELVGTPRYMSPEQARGSRDIDVTTDLYALGVILFEFITGKVLFEAEAATAVALMHITEPVPPLVPREGVKVLSGFEAVVRVLLAKDQRSRPQSATEVRAMLAPFLTERTTRRAPEIPLDPDQFHDPAESPVDMSTSGSGVRRKGEVRFNPPMVGRRQELRELWRFSREALTLGRGSVVFISGSTGMGKTRLLETFKDGILDVAEMDWFQGETTEESSHGLEAVRSALAQVFGLRNENRADARELISLVMERWGKADKDEVERLTTFFRPSESPWLLVKGHFGDDRDDMDRADRELLFGSIERCLRRAAAERPFVVTLEDLHWASAATREFLEYLTPRFKTTPAPIIILATLRADSPRIGEWEGVSERLGQLERVPFHQMALGPMADKPHTDLLRAMLKTSPNLADYIIKLTQGSPLHTIHVVRFLCDKGHIKEKQGVWDLIPGRRAKDLVPPQVADLLLARLTHLVEGRTKAIEFNQIIDRCAMIGRRVPFRLLRRFVEIEASLLPRNPCLAPHLEVALDFFQKEGILTEDVDDPEEGQLFSHGLLREVINQRISGKGTGRETQLAAARAKEIFFVNELDAHAEDIAGHYKEARFWDEALEWTVRAAEVARRSWDNRACETLYLQAQDLAREIGDPLHSTHRRIFEALGELCLIEGRYGEAVVHFNEAFDAAEEAGEGNAMAHLLFLRGNVAREMGDFPKSDAFYRECLAVSRALNDRAGIGRALLGMSKLARHRADLPEAHKFLSAAEEQFELQSDQRALADCRRQRAFVHMREGKWEEARRFLKRALELNREIGDKRGLAHVHRDLAALDVLHGHLEHGQIHARKALNLFESIGTQFGFAQTLATMGTIHKEQKHPQAANKLFNRALAIFEALESGQEMSRTRFQLGAVAIGQDNIREARTQFTMVHEQASLSEHAFLEGMGLAGLAWVAAKGEDPKSCRTYLQHAHRRLPKEALFFPDLVNIYESCADCFEKNNELPLALACRRKADHLSASLKRKPRKK